MLEDGPSAHSRATHGLLTAQAPAVRKELGHIVMCNPRQTDSFTLEIKRLSWVKWDKWTDPKSFKTPSKCLRVVPFDVLVMPRNFLNVYSFLRAAEFSSHPLEPWQRRFLKMPD